MTRLPHSSRYRLLFLGAVALLFACWWPRLSVFSQEFRTPSVDLQVIVVHSAEQADQALARLRRGEDFAAVARKVSIDPNAATGGYVRNADPRTLRPELRTALVSMKPGSLSGVIPVAGDFVILRLLSSRGGLEPPVQADASSLGMGPNRRAALRPGIQYPADVAGQVLADMLFEKYPKPAGWQQDLREVCRIRKESLATGVADLRRSLTAPQPDSTPESQIQTHYALAQLQAYEGNMDAAIREWEGAYGLAAASFPAGVPQILEVLGVAYLHKSEMENSLYTHPGDRCLFPPRGSFCFARSDDSSKAIDYFSRYLALQPARADQIQVRWLLNLAYLTLGKYPDGVPPADRIPPSVFASEEPMGRFTDVAPTAGLDFASMAGGVAVDDFENNGLLDIVVSSYDVCQPLRYFHNNGDGAFTDRTVQAGLADQLGGLNILQADYNNDGCMDLLVLRGAWEFPERKSLLRNNCNGTFTDVTRAAGLAEPATRTQTAVWADINNDGLLDLFVGNENSPSQLFLNKGDGTFEDISHAAGIDRVAFTKGVTAADYDHDGYVDFYVSNLYGGNFLYHNNHNNTFTEVSEKAGVHQPGAQSFATWFFDYDNDGWPDLFVTGYDFSTDQTIRSYLHLPTSAGTMKLYRNLGNGTFQDVTAATHMDRINTPMGANFGDIDNDGYLDIYLATGGPEYGALSPKMLLRNHDGRYFADVTAASGTGDLHKGHGVAFADLGSNGQEDLVVSIGGATPGDAHQFRLFRNPGNSNDWIDVKLIGVRSNRAAIGAQIRVTVKNGSQAPRSVDRTVNSGGSFGANPLEQHIGLGPHATIQRLEVWWPVSRTRQSFTNVRTDQFIAVQEFATRYEKLTRRPFRIGSRTAR
ncbi:MAG TPA: FG-GAP-like repeat-containing protein [Acidobacteriaceae bacterium]|jgi:hypothetical protein|nr:FG-GAP-like repeat-containing protein [Acidobacteriaceae bacterium]